MLRSEIVRGTERLLKAISDSGLDKAVQLLRRSTSRADRAHEVSASELLNVYTRFYTYYETSFSEVEKRLMAIFRLDFFVDSNWWSTVIGVRRQKGSESTQAGQIEMEVRHAVITAISRLDFVQEYLPQILAMLIRDTDTSAKSLARETLPGSEQGDRRIILILAEEEGKLSTPDRIIAAIESIVILYDTTADLMSLSKSDLMLASTDSGSDKVFDFTGLGDVIGKVKEILLSAWENAVYFRERKTSERVELIAKSLPVIEQIGELEEKGKIDPEKAELMRRGIINGVCKFVDTGSMIPEMGGNTVFSPRKILKARNTLLLPAPELQHHHDESRGGEGNSDQMPYEDSTSSMDEISEEEMREAVDEIRRRKKQGSDRS